MARESTLIIGASGTGKTNFALTWPTPGLMLDLEMKSGDALPGRLDGWEVMEFQDEPIPESLQMHERKATVVSSTKPVAWREFTRVINEVWRSQKAGDTTYKSIIVDSWSALCNFAARELHSVKGRLGLPLSIEDYGLLNAKYTELLPVLVGIPCEYLVLTAHEEASQDDLMKVISMTPWTVGQAIRTIMPTKFNNVYRTRVIPTRDGIQYVCDTRSSGIFTMGKTRHSKLPRTCPQDFQVMTEISNEGV